MLSFFIHNCILPILANQAKPQNNVRDLGIGYILVAVSYFAVGAILYLAHHKGKIDEDILNNFAEDEIAAVIARLAFIFQLLSVFPLICYIMRIQLFGLLYGNHYPSFWHVFAMNLMACLTCTLTSIFYPHIGDILRFTGSACGLIYVFVLPIGVHLLKTYWPNGYPERGYLQGREDSSAINAALPPHSQSVPSHPLYGTSRAHSQSQAQGTGSGKRTYSDVISRGGVAAQPLGYVALGSSDKAERASKGLNAHAQAQQVPRRSVSSGPQQPVVASGAGGKALPRDYSYGSASELEPGPTNSAAAAGSINGYGGYEPEQEWVEPPPRDVKFYASLVFHALLICFGLATLLAQFLE